MIKLSQLKDDIPNKTFSVEFHSPRRFYEILGRIKEHPTTKSDRTWKFHLVELLPLMKSLLEVGREDIHMPLSLFRGWFEVHKYRKEMLRLRNMLDGVDSGVRFKNKEKLLPFQHVGVEFLSQVRNGLLADKVGLGKTIQAIGLMMKLYQTAAVSKAIMVVPSTLKKKWQRDIKHFNGEDSLILEGTADKRKLIYRKYMNGNDLFMIVTYDILRRDWNYIKNFMPKNFAVVFDEVQYLKNPSSQRSRVSKLLASTDRCVGRYGLSATYIENGLQDMFGVMLIIDERIFGNYYMAFANKYLNLDYFGRVNGTKNLDDARNKMKYCSIRRRKPQVQEQLDAMLPKVVENTLWVDLTTPQKRLYNQVLQNVIDKINDAERAGKVSTANAMTIITLLLQVCLSTEMFDYEELSSAKMETLLEILPDIVEENKVLIFCHYVRFVDIIQRELNKAGIKCLAMHGKRTEGHSKNRQNTVDIFSNSKDVNVLVTSDIAAEGLDVPAASYVINMDILWNPAKMTQRNGRIDRLSQKKKTIYTINILSNGTMEEEMHDRIYEKYKVALQVMDDNVEESRIKKLTFRDIKKMLKRVT